MSNIAEIESFDSLEVGQITGHSIGLLRIQLG
jgi:hypothetical protein